MQTSGAPASVSTDVIQFTRFKPSNNGRGLTMHTCAAIATVGTTGVTGTGQWGLIAESGNNYGAVALSLTNPLWAFDGTSEADGFLSPIYDLIASAFVRYRVLSCKFHYAPQLTTTVEGRLVFAFANDPTHPLILPPVTAMSQSNLLALADSMPFAPWRPWSMDVTSSIQVDNKYYTYTPETSTTVEVIRFDNFGSIGLIISDTGLTIGPAANYGILYMELETELQEFCPVSLIRPSLYKKIKSTHKVDKKGKKEKSLIPSKVRTCSCDKNIVCFDGKQFHQKNCPQSSESLCSPAKGT